MRRVRRTIVVIGALVLAGCGASAPERSTSFEYRIPAGTAALLEQGESVEIMPAIIEARVGDRIRIVNEDRRGYLLGPFYVDGGETLTQRFSEAGVFAGACEVNPTGTIEVIVRAEAA
jgi:hypothetical protein